MKHNNPFSEEIVQSPKDEVEWGHHVKYCDSKAVKEKVEPAGAY